MKIKIPPLLYQVLDEITSQGYEAFVVGGFVRNSLLSQLKDIPTDYDVTTSARPEVIKHLFKNDKQFDIGLRHGTVAIRRKSTTIEITTYRIESNYTDGRHPDIVEFVDNLKQDLSRRDFTINALAADKEGNVVDEFNGLTDLKSRVIRTVGNPIDRFTEDSLRMFRAVRFAVRFQFQIENDTKNAIRNNIDLLDKHAISGERIFTEVSGILKHFKEGVRLLAETKLFGYLFQRNLSSHELNFLDQINSGDGNWHPMVSWTLFFFIASNETTELTLKTIKLFFERFPGIRNQNQYLIMDLIEILDILSNLDIKFSVNLCKILLYQVSIKKRSNLGFIGFMELFEQLITSMQFDSRVLRLQTLHELVRLYSEITSINGNTVKEIGFQGKKIGAIIEFSNYLKVIDENFDDVEFLSMIEVYLSEGIILDFTDFLGSFEYTKNFMEYVVFPIILTARRLYHGTNRVSVLTRNSSFIEILESSRLANNMNIHIYVDKEIMKFSSPTILLKSDINFESTGLNILYNISSIENSIPNHKLHIFAF